MMKRTSQRLNTIIQLQLEDNTKRRIINSEGNNELDNQNIDEPRRAQTEIYNWLDESNKENNVY